MASVKVALRVRPFNEREQKIGCLCVVQMEGDKTKLLHKNNKGEVINCKEFTFDYSYWSHNLQSEDFVSQEKVFTDLGSTVVKNALLGYNACVFAYGQTGSGKTFTMMGSKENPGLIPRICRALFTNVQNGRESGNTYRIEVSYLEIYNEKVKDLLKSNKKETAPLKVREHFKTGPYVENLSQHVVTQYSEVEELMTRGNNFRTTASTNMNDSSSRSHAIFTLTFTQAKLQSRVPLETKSKINLVDLAGSERADATGATGKRLKEGSHINKSLVTLGIIISALAEQGSNPKKETFTRYRDSTLTFLLKDSLGGNSKTIMIATVSPADINYGETLGTLRYANRAKNIVNKPTINEDPNVKLIRSLREEIAELKRRIGDGSLNIDQKIVSEANTLRGALSQKEAQERELTDRWNEKWRQTQCILQEQKTLELRKTGESGKGVILDSERHHLVIYHRDLRQTGLTLYHLNEELTSIGSSLDDDVRLEDEEVLSNHLVIKLKEGKAFLECRSEGYVIVDDEIIKNSVNLSHGALIKVGSSHLLRYNDPQEAARIRRSGNGSSMNLSKLSFLSRSTTDLARSYDQLPATSDEAKEQNGLGARRATEDPILHKRPETTDCVEISTQTCTAGAHSHPGTPLSSEVEVPRDINKKSSLTLPLDDKTVEFVNSKRSSSLDSTPASDTFYTATSILTPDVNDLLSPGSPLASPDLEKSVDAGENNVVPNIYSPINPVVELLNSPGAAIGATTSTPKAENLNQRTREGLTENCRPRVINTKFSEEEEEEEEESLPENNGNDEGSELIRTDDDLSAVNTVAEKLHSEDVSAVEQLKELDQLKCHYNDLGKEMLEEIENKGDELPEETKEEDVHERKARPDGLNLVSVLKEKRIIMLIEKEVRRRVRQEAALADKKNCGPESEEHRKFQCDCRMVRSSSPSSLKAIPRQLSPSELRPYSSMSAECAYSYEGAHGLLYESGSSSDDLLLSPVPLHSPLGGEFEMTCGICVCLPSYEFRRFRTKSYWEYQVRLSVGSDTWSIYRRYSRFRELHLSMCRKYGAVIQDLYFPPRRIFGNNSLSLIEKRRRELEVYLQQLVTLCSEMEGSPLCDVTPSRQLLEKFSEFFRRGKDDINRFYPTS